MYCKQTQHGLATVIHHKCAQYMYRGTHLAEQPSACLVGWLRLCPARPDCPIPCHLGTLEPAASCACLKLSANIAVSKLLRDMRAERKDPFSNLSAVTWIRHGLRYHAPCTSHEPDQSVQSIHPTTVGSSRQLGPCRDAWVACSCPLQSGSDVFPAEKAKN